MFVILIPLIQSNSRFAARLKYKSVVCRIVSNLATVSNDWLCPGVKHHITISQYFTAENCVRGV